MIGRNSHWEHINTNVPHDFILDPLLFLICKNYLPCNLSSNLKLFADDTSSFSILSNIYVSVKKINNDLNRISG